MMSILSLSLAVATAIAIWPVNRWVMCSGGRPELYGFWLSTFATVTSGCTILLTGQFVLQPVVWISGVGTGFAFAVGFCMIIMYCLQIGPTSATTAVNNLGLVWPVVLGILWLKPHPVNRWIIAGALLTIFSLFFFGFSSSRSGNQPEIRKISIQWLLWALVGWILAGVSMTGHLIYSIYVPGEPILFLFVFLSTAAVILAFVNLWRGNRWLRGKEVIAGMIAGPITVITGVTVLDSLKYFSAEVVFPFVSATPVIVVLLLGKVVYREHLNKLGWIACIVGVVGLMSLSLGQIS